ncbi:MAG: S1/P1 nuclease [Gemmataceae bacterium]
MRFVLGAVASVFLLPNPAQAWNKGGHMVSASIAHAVLKHEHPDAIPKIVAILKQHPQYEHWAEKIAALPHLSDEDKDVYLFMLAARWPDDIRDTDEYHHGNWHFINLPYIAPGHPFSHEPPPPRDDNLIRAFELNRARARTGQPAERAIAMCWVFHLIGDGHQPLHTSNLYSDEYPRGDHGGNSFYIRVHHDSAPIGLHQFWDDLVIGSDHYQSVHNRAIELRLRPEFAKDKLTELRTQGIEHWVKNESFKLVDEVVYRHGKIAGSTTREHASALPDDYPKVAKPVAGRRIVLAGYRIADVARQIVE